MEKAREIAGRDLTANLLELLDKKVVKNGDLLEFVECSMYEAAMKYARGNQVNAAKAVGVARGTLRTKLKQFFNTTLVGGLYHDRSSRETKSKKYNHGKPTIPNVVLLKNNENKSRVVYK